MGSLSAAVLFFMAGIKGPRIKATWARFPNAKALADAKELAENNEIIHLTK
jgi:hypothetical protein